jgi:hypothetical protein
MSYEWNGIKAPRVHYDHRRGIMAAAVVYEKMTNSSSHNPSPRIEIPKGMHRVSHAASDRKPTTVSINIKQTAEPA